MRIVNGIFFSITQIFVFFVWPSFADSVIVYPTDEIFILPYKTAIYETTTKVACGTPLKVLGSDQMWYYVETKDGVAGYVKKELVSDDLQATKAHCEDTYNKPVSQKMQVYKSSEYKQVVAKFPIKVLSSPGFEGSTNATASPGEELLAFGKKGTWYKVRFKNTEGWVADSWVTEDSDEINSIRNKLRAEENKRKAKTQEQKRMAKAQEQEKIAEAQRETKKLKEGFLLKLVSWNWHSEHGYAIAQGLVRNISGKRIPNLEVIVTWYDNDKNFISFKTSYVEYTTLMPKQVTPFRVIETFNPLMKNATISFKVKGSEIPWYKN